MHKLDQVVSVLCYDHSTGKEFEELRELESIIRNPSGVKMDTLGLHLFNIERRKRGLTEYTQNPSTGTFDEVKVEEDLPPDDVCCCGDSMENHASPFDSGHSLVSMRDYALSKDEK